MRFCALPYLLSPILDILRVDLGLEDVVRLSEET